MLRVTAKQKTMVWLLLHRHYTSMEIEPSIALHVAKGNRRVFHNSRNAFEHLGVYRSSPLSLPVAFLGLLLRGTLCLSVCLSVPRSLAPFPQVRSVPLPLPCPPSLLLSFCPLACSHPIPRNLSFLLTFPLADRRRTS